MVSLDQRLIDQDWYLLYKQIERIQAFNLIMAHMYTLLIKHRQR